MNSLKKKIIFLSSGVIILLVISLLGINLFKDSKNSKKQQDERSYTTGIAMMLETESGSGEYTKTDDTSWANVVARGYTFNSQKSTCKNGSTLTWNEEKKTITFSGNSTDNCTVYFDLVPQEKTGPTFITDKVGETINLEDNGETYTGAIVNENGIRFEGKNPNNYVEFNDELWRIIGVFDEGTHGRSGEQLVKLIRANKLSQYYQWDSNQVNNWNNATLKTTLNTNYYNNTNINACSNYNSTSCTAATVTGEGIKTDAARNMIQEVQWKIGGHNTSGVTASVMYEKERGTTVAGSSGATAVSTENLPIGLMYPSDYGYAVLESDCVRTTNLSSYDGTATCHTENWLFNASNPEHTWTLSPVSGYSSLVWSVYSAGGVGSSYANNTFAAVPVLYLKAGVRIAGGQGTKTSPYTLSM